MPKRFEGKTAVVTGGASGIGLAIVRRFVSEGGCVAVGDINPESLSAVAREFGDKAVCVPTNVVKEDNIAHLVAQAVDRFGSVDVGFNCAGANRPAYILDVEEDGWDFTHDLCLKGVLFAMKHQSRRMVKQGTGGVIVNISSFAANVPMHAGSAYSTAKVAVEMLCKSGALELAEHRIRVNAILPGYVQTPMTRSTFENEEAYASFLARIPLNRPAQAEEVAGPALFLASDDASYISGASLLVDGAWSVSGAPDMRPFRGTAKFGCV